MGSAGVPRTRSYSAAMVSGVRPPAAPRLLLAGLCLCATGCVADDPRDSEDERPFRLDPSHAFYHPPFATDQGRILATTSQGPIEAGTYLRYLAAVGDHAHLEDLVYDLALTAECKRRRLAPRAPIMARSMATLRLAESGRTGDQAASDELRRKFINTELRELRENAILGAARRQDDDLLKELFERRHGVGGEQVQVRQVLVSFAATRERLMPPGKEPPPSAATVKARARARAQQLYETAIKSPDLTPLLGESDERITRRMLRRPATRAQAGILQGYNYRRYGANFAAAVRRLQPGQISEPIESSTGFHLIELISRKTTRLESVEAGLRRELQGRKPTPHERQQLRRRLLEEMAVQRDF